MALLTRARHRSPADRATAAAAEAVERARDVAGPTVERAREAAAPTVERARDAAAPRVEWAREAAAPSVERAREVAGPTVERAREASRPALAQLRSGIASLLRMAVRLAALLPGFGAQVLEAVATLMGRLADTSAQIAHIEPPSKVRRRRVGLWFVGGFVTGAAAGYVAHDLLTRDDDHDHDHAHEFHHAPEGEGEALRAAPEQDIDETPSAEVPG